MPQTATQPLTESALDTEFEKRSSEISDYLKKIDLVKNFKPTNGIRVYQYPSGITYSVLDKICSSLAKEEAYTLDSITLESKGDFILILSKNGSLMNQKIERVQKSTGGIHSMEVTDFGEFRLLYVKDGKVHDGKDFSLYRIKSHLI